MRGLLQTADSETRDLNATEDARFAVIKTELVGLDKRIGRAEAVEAAERSLPAPAINGRVGDGDFEERCRDYSLLKAMAAQVPGSNVDAGSEREISRELERR